MSHDLSLSPPLQNGCCLKDHTVTTSPDTPPPSPSTSIIYDLLLSHHDVIMPDKPDKPDKQGRARRRDSSSGPHSPNSVQLCLLRNEDRIVARRVSLNSAQSVSADESVQQARGGEVGGRSDTAASQQHPVNSVTMDTAQQPSHDSSEMEEDEDEAHGTAAAHAAALPPPSEWPQLQLHVCTCSAVRVEVCSLCECVHHPAGEHVGAKQRRESKAMVGWLRP